ncbi:hypothetical protein EV586_104400 [Tumebacillus sp. BK434]|nr:FDLD family class I lanthipeptide [Tumebacillus sp. BK434]TCP54774.1 hypothetical protein EV586_104400 [Tumebacillus sp. BK434]
MENFFDLDVQIEQITTTKVMPGVTQTSCAFVCYPEDLTLA